jgi:hypothetical protein
MTGITRRRLAIVVGATAGGLALLSAGVIGVGLIGSAQSLAVSSEPLPETVLAEATTGPDGATSAVVSNLPQEMIVGLPEYTAVHSHDVYAQVQTWVKLCMREAGYSYQFDLAENGGDVVGLVSTGFIPFPADMPQDEQQALYGDPDDLLPDYDWTRGGCYGQAIHKAGLLDGGATAFTAEEAARIAATYDEMVNPPAPPYGYAGSTPGLAETLPVEQVRAATTSIVTCLAERGIRFETYDRDGRLETFDGADEGDTMSLVGAYSMMPIEGAATESFWDDASIALFGPATPADAPYDWRTGGCYGQAIHAAGIPGAQ